ncbi:MAG TPA: ferrous iron transporter B [Candidatus Eubacterium faecigallinarum]|nr:ferrous iron transporter B [Candidatus Eubacterium faecigallinarum]
MEIKIALAGNPNCGKTTLFNALTGSNQFVGNWPGVTVEKKEGRLKKDQNVIVTDLPGVYSLSPYTLEEVVARNYLVDERPDAILNIIDATNLERNLYLTTQLIELGIPVVAALNMMDIVKKNGDRIRIDELSRRIGCPIVEISALKMTGIDEAAQAATEAARSHKTAKLQTFSATVENVISDIEKIALHGVPAVQKRWYAVKVFERDEKVLARLKLSTDTLKKVERLISDTEKKLDDDAESIITNERYNYITDLIKGAYKRAGAGKLSTSDKIDRIVTNRFLALPIFVIVMFLVYYISWTTVGTFVTDWMNDGVFGDGWHLTGQSQYNDAMNDFAAEYIWTQDVVDTVNAAAADDAVGAKELQSAMTDGDYAAFEEAYASYGDSLAKDGYDISYAVNDALTSQNVPQSLDYGIYVPGIPTITEHALDSINCADWLKSLVVDGIIGGVGAVLGFVPQMLVLFILLAFLEGCGYMSRVAFIMDRIFRKFGLSGKSFIPMLVGTGCGVPGIMASRTIENERDRRMTVITTTFIPCSAKMPVVALISTVLFHGEWWVAPSAYFVGVAAVVISGIMLKKTRLFAGDTAPFVMELPAYHMPTAGNVLRSMWERASSFIKKAGTVILIATVFVWVASHFGKLENGGIGFDTDMQLESSLLGIIGNAIKTIFIPLGFGNIKAAIATIMGLVAKEEVVGVFGVLDFEEFTPVAGYSFLVFNLLCAPCCAAMSAIRREMNSAKWTLFAIGYQCVFAYAVSFMIYQFGMLFIGQADILGVIAAVVVLGFMIYMLVRPQKKYNKPTVRAVDA